MPEAGGNISLIFTVRAWQSSWICISQKCDHSPWLRQSLWNLNLQTCPQLASISCALQFKFSHPSTGSCRGFSSWVYVMVKLWFSRLTCLFLQYWRHQFSLWPHFCAISKKSSWLFFQHYWVIIDIWHCVSIRCTTRWFDPLTHCEMITTVRLVNVSITSHNYLHFCDDNI